MSQFPLVRSNTLMNERNNNLWGTPFISSNNYYKSQLIQQLDQQSYHIISLGFIFLTIGILSRAAWPNEARAHIRIGIRRILGHLLIHHSLSGITILPRLIYKKLILPKLK